MSVVPIQKRRRQPLAVNLMGNEKKSSIKSGITQLMAGGGVALIGTTLVPLLANLFS